MKAKREYKILPRLPERLECLREIAYNVVFSWHSELRDLFKRMDPGLWSASGHNPVLLLGLIQQERLNELAADDGFLVQLEEIKKRFDYYVGAQMSHMEMDGQDAAFRVAYLSAEFGLTTCLPIYSGGLGILAGDHLKAASDLKTPLVGVGILYQEGYFSQYLNSDGWQMETYPVNNFDNIPVKQIKDADGRPVTVQVDFKGRPVHIAIWRVDVGRIPLYLLDTNVPENPEDIRLTTAQLYGGDKEMRLRQEIVLGVGGIRALKALGIEPTVVHMNEGHAAFSALERINIFKKEKNLSFDSAREIVQASTIFTTHTPVPAGNDTFDPNLIRDYLTEYSKEIGVNIKVLLGYGRVNPRDENEPFGVTPLALRLSAHANGVSALHGYVARNMWQGVWPHNPVEDIPIDHVTNGIHVPTWVSREYSDLFNRYLGPNWTEEKDNKRLWAQVEEIPTTELWRAHVRCREALVGFTRKRLVEQLKKRGAPVEEVQAAGEVLNPEALTIGFARRFATYKRATLLFRDSDRLARILNDPARPVQIIIAGKAHPQDNEGKEFIKEIIHMARQERFRHKIVFLEDYNIHIANVLVAGTDVWLNTPRRPLEACGTSGMKALANGSLNLSILDGWWDEGYEPKYGFAIGKGEEYTDLHFQDETESRDLYNLLEKQVVPLFYQRGLDGIPRGWVEKMRAGLRDLVPQFSASRMVQDYLKFYYEPCSKRYLTLSKDNMAGATDLAAWRSRIMTSWHELSVLDFQTSDGQEALVGDIINVKAHIRLGSLSPEDITVEAYYGNLDHRGDFIGRETAVLNADGKNGDECMFTGRIPCTTTGRFGMTVRITPSKQRMENPFVMGLVLWA